MKKYILALWVVIILISCNGQLNKSRIEINPDHIRREAIKMTDFLTERNCDSFIAFQYPKIIEMFGGRQKAFLAITKSWKNHDADSLKITRITIGEPTKVISYKDELQCTIPQNVVIKSPKVSISVKSTLIAISKDGGNRWYFIDAVGDNIKNIRSTFPNISKELVIPEQTKPEVINEL